MQLRRLDEVVQAQVLDLLDTREPHPREVHFDAPTWRGLGRLLAWLDGEYPDAQVSRDGDDERLARPFHEWAPLAKRGLRFYFAEGTCPLWSFQLLAGQEDAEPLYVELSFERAELQRYAALLEHMVSFLEQARVHLGARRAVLGFEGVTLQNDEAFLVLDERGAFAALTNGPDE